jgi:hypothetical protein
MFARKVTGGRLSGETDTSYRSPLVAKLRWRHHCGCDAGRRDCFSLEMCQQVASLQDLQVLVSSFANGLQYAGGVDENSPCSHSLRQPVTSVRHRHMAGELVSTRRVALAAWPMCFLSMWFYGATNLRWCSRGRFL